MICTKCKIDKTEDEFSFKNSNRNTRRTKCRKCHSNYRKEKYLENKEKELSQVRTYQKNNPENILEKNKKKNLKNLL